MSVSKVVGRALLSSIFIQNGINHLQQPEYIVKAARGAEIPQPELAVKISSGVMVGAGVMLALGIAPKLAGTLLAVNLIPVTVVGHPFWDKKGAERQTQQIHFMKNVAMFGALLAMGD